MSTRAIAPIVGVGIGTVHRDIESSAVPNGTPEQRAIAPIVGVSNYTVSKDIEGVRNLTPEQTEVLPEVTPDSESFDYSVTAPDYETSCDARSRGSFLFSIVL